MIEVDFDWINELFWKMISQQFFVAMDCENSRSRLVDFRNPFIVIEFISNISADIHWLCIWSWFELLIIILSIDGNIWIETLLYNNRGGKQLHKINTTMATQVCIFILTSLHFFFLTKRILNRARQRENDRIRSNERENE